MAISLSESRVLIVDDNDFNRRMLAMVIGRAGITAVEFAVDGVDGLRKVERFRPDLVLLDVDMPNMDGLEMCRRLRQSASHADLPVLFQTVLDSDEEQVRCFEAGGNDFISKPIKSGECVARVRHQLERRKLFKDLGAFRERVEKELRHAQAMQLSLLPEPRRVAEIGERHRLSIFQHFETSSELGGDFWNVFDIDDHRVGFLIVDFAGHGITAAINTFRLHTLIDRLSAAELDPAEWLGRLNLSLKDVLPVGQFATAFFGVLDTRADTLTYAAAGAPNPVLGVGSEVRLLDSAGLLLGVSRRAQYKTRVVTLPPGGFLFLYSDALIESRTALDQTFGHAGVPDLVTASLRAQPDAPLGHLLARFFAEVQRPLRDDLTAVWIARH